MDDARARLFFELFSGLPRQGPGDDECTRRALFLIPRLRPRARILDLGSGTGAQSMALARCTDASIVAVDLHQPFVAELKAIAERLGFGNRIKGVVADMARLDFLRGRFDVVWSEGAIYNIGFDRGLQSWRPMVRPGGHVVVSELCWLERQPGCECVEYLTAEYPGIRDVETNREAVCRAGYVPVGEFSVPSSAWWRDYYDPLQRNVAAFRMRHGGDLLAAEVAGEAEHEIEMFRRHSDHYGYVFFVMRIDGD